MEKKKANKNVWIYEEDYNFIKLKIKYGEKFADGLRKIIKNLQGEKDAP